MQKTSLSEFGRIDQTGDPATFVTFLDAACATASFQQYKQHLIRALDVKPGRRILDVGCGTGDDAREMARHVCENGRIVGVDNSQAMIDIARQRAEGTGISVEFHAADALALPFETGSFDGACADRSLMHVPDARRALAEMARVTRPGGRVAVYEVDFGTVTIDVDDRTLARRVIDCWRDSMRNPWLGRRMPALFQELSLRDIAVRPYTLILAPILANPIIGEATVQRAVAQGRVTQAEGQSWLQQLTTLQQTARFFSTLTGFLVEASK
jgi:ubiquinone/menaquinone biosynthesis C-methylase UbiE